jgi:hypothetical protein
MDDIWVAKAEKVGQWMKIKLVGKDWVWKGKKNNWMILSIWKVIMVKDNLNSIWVWIYIPSKVEFLKYYPNEFLNIYVHNISVDNIHDLWDRLAPMSEKNINGQWDF